LVDALEKLARKRKDTKVIAVDVNDADFPLLKNYKKDMNLKKVILTADSFIFLQFKKKVKDLKVPSVVIIDKYGFIRFFANGVGSKEIDKFSSELEKILNSLK